jgi:hypothetical protein
MIGSVRKVYVHVLLQSSFQKDEEDDELLFHMSDVEDVGFSDWTHKEDDLDSLPSVLWNVENSRPRPDEDEDSGNGNSTDSGSLFHCTSFTLLDA